MELSRINPFIRYARAHQKFVVTKGFSQCYDCRLFYIKSGTGLLYANNQKYEFLDNTVIYLPARTKYRFSFQHNGQAWSILIFNFDLIDEFFHLKDSLGTADAREFIPERSPEYDFPEAFSQIIVQTVPGLYDPLKDCTTRFLNNSPYYRETSSAILKNCLFELLGRCSDDSASRIIGQITDYIHQNYQDSTLTNERISEQFGYHPYYLSQLFKERTGKTLHNYLLYYRIRIAKNYLITTDLDINTISWKCGFNSCAYFIKQFRQQTGTTPKQYRNTQTNQLL